MKMMKDAELIAKYEGATEIYALNRKKKMTEKEKLFDAAVALFSPLPGIVEEADLVADMGTYFLVKKENQEILVRVQGEELAEEIVTGKLEYKSKSVFIYDRNQYAISKELISGKARFTLNV